MKPFWIVPLFAGAILAAAPIMAQDNSGTTPAVWDRPGGPAAIAVRPEPAIRNPRRTSRSWRPASISKARRSSFRPVKPPE